MRTFLKHSKNSECTTQTKGFNIIYVDIKQNEIVYHKTNKKNSKIEVFTLWCAKLMLKINDDRLIIALLLTTLWYIGCRIWWIESLFHMANHHFTIPLPSSPLSSLSSYSSPFGVCVCVYVCVCQIGYCSDYNCSIFWMVFMKNTISLSKWKHLAYWMWNVNFFFGFNWPISCAANFMAYKRRNCFFFRWYFMFSTCILINSLRVLNVKLVASIATKNGNCQVSSILIGLCLMFFDICLFVLIKYTCIDCTHFE